MVIVVYRYLLKRNMPTRPLSLEAIVAHKKRLIAQKQVVTPLASLRALASMQERPRDVCSAIRGSHVALLAQVQNLAPEEETVDIPYDAVALARRLVALGAQALLVLTDDNQPTGGIEHLTLATHAVDVPVIRQDYIIDEYQVIETRAAGADGLLLRASLVNAATMRRLISATQRNRMTEIVEVRNEDELLTALPYEPRIIAINNHDPETGVVDLTATRRLRPLIPAHILTLSRGGLYTPQDVAAVFRDVDGIIVGPDVLLTRPAAAGIRDLLHITTKPHPIDSDPPAN